MPTRFFRLDCGHSSPGSLTSRPRCHQCGAPGTFARWSLSRLEAMARYQYVWGFKAMGPHRSEVSRILGPVREQCGACDGEGLVWPPGGDRYAVCAQCEGTGGFWDCSRAELGERRRRVLRQYPDAGVVQPSIRFLSGRLIHNLATGEVIDGGA